MALISIYRFAWLKSHAKFRPTLLPLQKGCRYQNCYESSTFYWLFTMLWINLIWWFYFMSFLSSAYCLYRPFSVVVLAFRCFYLFSRELLFLFTSDASLISFWLIYRVRLFGFMLTLWQVTQAFKTHRPGEDFGRAFCDVLCWCFCLNCSKAHLSSWFYCSFYFNKLITFAFYSIYSIPGRYLMYFYYFLS